MLVYFFSGGVHARGTKGDARRANVAFFVLGSTRLFQLRVTCPLELRTCIRIRPVRTNGRCYLGAQHEKNSKDRAFLPILLC